MQAHICTRIPDLLTVLIACIGIWLPVGNKRLVARPVSLTRNGNCRSYLYLFPALSHSLSLSLFVNPDPAWRPACRSSVALTWLTTCVTASRANTILDLRTSQSHNRPSARLSAASTCFIAPSAISPVLITLSVSPGEIDVIDPDLRTVRSTHQRARGEGIQTFEVSPDRHGVGVEEKWPSVEYWIWTSRFVVPSANGDTYSPRRNAFHSRSRAAVFSPFTFLARGSEVLLRERTDDQSSKSSHLLIKCSAGRANGPLGWPENSKDRGRAFILKR